MSRSRRASKRSGKKVRIHPATTPSPPSEAKAQPSRSVLKDLMFGLLVCLVFFGLLEIAFRIVGFPAIDASEDPFVGFSGTKPLFEVTEGIASTAAAKRPYFNTESFQANKPPHTYRIFCFGGSTTYGHPFDGRTAFSRWLQELLKASEPGANFEVINAGGISYASYRIVPLIRETLRYQPDLMIVYTGHNEFLERRTYSAFFDQGGTLIAIRSIVENLRVYEALKQVLEKVWPGLRRAERDKSEIKSLADETDANLTTRADAGSGKSMLTEEVNAILDRSAGLDLYHRDDEFTRAVIRHFAHNLDVIITLCKNARVPVFLVEPASNLRDFSPFKSEHGKSLTMQEKSKLDQRITQAADLVKKSRFDAALPVLEEAASKDPLFAETYFWEGRSLIGSGRHAGAKASFVKARDLDVCPLRCISAIEEKIAEVAQKRAVPLIRFREALERIASETCDRLAVPGNESFLDHVHPTIERHQLLAEQLLQEMVARGILKPARDLTGEERSTIYQTVMKGLDPQFFAAKDLNLAKTLKWAGKKDEAREALKRAAALLHDNPEVHKMWGSYLLDEGKYDEAIKEYSQGVKLSGNDPVMEFSLALACHRAGLRQEALRILDRLTQADQTAADASANLAMIHLEEGRVQEARRVLEPAIKRRPRSEVLFAPFGLALAMSDKVDEAIPWMLRAVQAEPGNPGHLYNLAGMYAMCGKTSEALAALNQAVDKGYTSADKIAADPVFGPIRNLPEFMRILERIRK